MSLHLAVSRVSTSSGTAGIIIRGDLEEAFGDAVVAGWVSSGMLKQLIDEAVQSGRPTTLGINAALQRRGLPILTKRLRPGTTAMSLQLDTAKAVTMARLGTSSPAFAPVQAGIFGSIGRVLSGAGRGLLSGGPIGAISGGLRALGGTSPAPVAPPPVPIASGTIQDALRRGGGVFGGQEATIALGPLSAGFRLGGGGFRGPAQAAPSMGIGPGPAGDPSGMHLNKTSYFLRDGTFVPERTRFVKNRRRNPMNPRALSRAIARIDSAKKVSRRLGRITIRAKKC